MTFVSFHDTKQTHVQFTPAGQTKAAMGCIGSLPADDDVIMVSMGQWVAGSLPVRHKNTLRTFMYDKMVFPFHNPLDT